MENMRADALLDALIASKLLVLEKGTIHFQYPWMESALRQEQDGVKSMNEQAALAGYWGQKLVLGLTGNIAVGKSTVLSMLMSLGAQVIDADNLVHDLREPGQPGYDALVQLLGEEVLRADGHVDTAKLAERAFRDVAILHRLEEIFRPLVIDRVEQMVRDSKKRVVVIEAIKLLEGELKDHVDAVWVVDAPREQQIERLIATRSLTREQAVARVDAQNPQEAKLAAADVIIDNAGDLRETQRQVLDAWADVLAILWLRRWLEHGLIQRFVCFSLETVGVPCTSPDVIWSALAALASGIELPHGISLTQAQSILASQE